MSALLRQARDDLVALDAALERIDDGTLQTCAVCGDPIAVERLRVAECADVYPLRVVTRRAVVSQAAPKPSSRTRRHTRGGDRARPFIGVWSIGAAVTNREYSSIDDAISRLAAVGADTRALMTAGFVAFGVALPVYSLALRRVVRGAAWLTAAATGVATLGVAALPLDRSATVDTWHGVLAGIGYVTLAATPLLAARPLWEQGHRLLGGLGVIAGAVAGVALVLTTTSLPTGLFQRLGLTAGDIGIATSALAIAAGQIRVVPPRRPRSE